MKTEKIMVQEFEFGLNRLDGVTAPNATKNTNLTLIEGRESRKKVRVFLVILLVFAAFFAIITRYGQMTKLNYEIADIKEALITQNAINSALSVDLEKKTNMMKIRHAAETELGMQEPDKYQIIYINVPRANSIVVAEQNVLPNENAIGIVNYLKGFLFGVN
ncbi:MAG: cell division protein FtsL [Clostridiales bacterium]|nr:cell division protein FtsL [Clostridiales bacterium]